MNREPSMTRVTVPSRRDRASGQPELITSAARDGVRALRLLRFPDVRDRTGLSRSTLWRLERRGEFPKHRKLSPNTVGWVEEELTAWIQSKIGAV